MLRTFNCGVGMIVIVSAENVQQVKNLITEMPSCVIGEIELLTDGNRNS